MADLPDYYSFVETTLTKAINLTSGLDAAKEASPTVGDVYVATDTTIVYVCFAAGTWTNVGVLYLLLAGGTMTGAIAMGGSKVTGLGAPTAAGDALRKGTRVTVSELPAMTDEKIWKGTGGNVEEISVPTAVPSGMIAMWHGLLANIPAGWVLCDGDNGTPDLRGRFVEGAADGVDPGATGGAKAKSTAGHNHSQGATGAGSSHTHTAGTTGAGSAHSHGAATIADAGEGAETAIKTIANESSHTHSGGSVGNEAAHTHSNPAIGSNTDSIADIRPKFYDIAFIMKT